jgi:GST-like protein
MNRIVIQSKTIVISNQETTERTDIKMEDNSYNSRMTIKDPTKLQLFSAATPNGMKVAAMLEELVDLRSTTEYFDYEPHTVDVRSSESRLEDFKECLNPNAKIPVLIDPNGPNNEPITLFESGAILIYLAEKYNVLLAPINTALRYETMKWFMWGATGISSQFKLFGFYFKHCIHPMHYCVARYTNECNRLLMVLEKQLAGHKCHWIVGGAFTIADITVWPWIYALYNNYDNAVRDVFKNFIEYPNVAQWYGRCMNRPATKRSLEVTALNF